jgi:hypothetical protein
MLLRVLNGGADNILITRRGRHFYEPIFSTVIGQ